MSINYILQPEDIMFSWMNPDEWAVHPQSGAGAKYVIVDYSIQVAVFEGDNSNELINFTGRCRDSWDHLKSVYPKKFDVHVNQVCAKRSRKLRKKGVTTWYSGRTINGKSKFYHSFVVYR